jgi:phosphoribosylamine---glycine ligase
VKTPFHFFSADGSNLPMALRLQREGHPVTWHVKSDVARLTGKGLVPFAKEPPTGAIVVFDCTGEGPRGTAYRKAGHLVIGGNPYDRPLELNRPEGARIARRAGMVTPPTYPFGDIPSALRFLRKTDGKWFVKVSGDGLEMDTYDAPDSEFMSRYLKYVQDQVQVKPFVLQQKVEGTEVSCNGWFNGHEFIPPFDITLEEKKCLAGDLGCRTGCESNVVWHAQDEKLADLTVGLVEEELAEEGYVGPVDINSIISADGTPQFLEFSARLGFDATQAWMRLIPEGELGEQLEAFVAGEMDRWEPVGGLSATLRLSIPPYPNWDKKMVSKMAGLPLDYALLDDEWVDPVDVMVGPECAGGAGMICTVGARGLSIEALRRELILRAESLEIPDKQYRVDPLKRVPKDMKALESLGLLGFQGWKA